MLFSLKLSPVDDRSLVLKSSSGGSIDEVSPPLRVLEGELGVGGVFDCECAGEGFAEKENEVFRGGTSAGRGGSCPFLSAIALGAGDPAFSSSTICEFDRLKSDMNPFEVVRLIGAGRAFCDGDGADTGRSDKGVEVLEPF